MLFGVSSNSKENRSSVLDADDLMASNTNGLDLVKESSALPVSKSEQGPQLYGHDRNSPQTKNISANEHCAHNAQRPNKRHISSSSISLEFTSRNFAQAAKTRNEEKEHSPICFYYTGYAWDLSICMAFVPKSNTTFFNCRSLKCIIVPLLYKRSRKL